MDQITYIPKTFYQLLYDTVTNQDFQQKTNMVVSVSLELYRVMVSSLLLLFIPQDCNNDMCTLSENLNETDHQYKIGFILNYITVATFILMYITEMRREEKLIKLLEVNPSISTDNESVGQRLEIFPQYKKDQLYNVDQQYKYACYFAASVFIINTIFSWNVIYPRSLGNQTLLNFVTNILFMIAKLSNVLTIIHTDDNIFFSAYLNTKVQFNDIDPREMVKIRKSFVCEYPAGQTESVCLDRDVFIDESLENLVEEPQVESPIEESLAENPPIEAID